MGKASKTKAMALKYSDLIKKDRPPLFHKVDDYLAWLLSEKDHLTKLAKKHDRKCYEIVQGIVGSLMVSGFKTSREFQDNIDPLDDWSWKVAMKNVIRRTTLNNYVIRLFLINKGPLGAIQMEFGEGSEISSGEVNLVLTQSLPQTDRTAIRAQMADYVNKEGQVSAKKILTWLYPVLETYFTNLSGKQAFGYTLNCLMTSDISKFCAMLTCVPIHNKQGKILTMHLNFEVATVIKYIPIHFQHPYPRYKPHSTLGQQMSNDVKKSVDDNKMKVVVYCKVGKPSPKASNAVDKQPKMSQAKQKRYQKVTTFKRVWTLDFSNVEQSMLRKCMKMDSLKPCTEALTLYDVISNKGKMLLPQLESNIKTTILLWLIRKHANDLKTGKEWFLTLVEKVISIMKSGFCPSFCQPNINIWRSGKASNGSWKVLALEAFTESLKDTYGAAMVKHSVGIYGRNTTITTNFDIDAFMQDLTMKHTKVNGKNSPPLKVKRGKTMVDFKDTADSTQRSSQVKSKQDKNIDNKTNGDKTPDKIAAGKTSNQRKSQTKSQEDNNIDRKTKEDARIGNKVPASKNNEKKNRRDTPKTRPSDEQKQSGEETNEPKSYSKESFEESTDEDFEESNVETLSKDISLPNPVENSDGFPSIVSNDKHDPNSKDGELMKRNTPIISDTDIQSREKSKSSAPGSTDNTPLSYRSRTITPLVTEIPTPIEKRPTSRSSFEGFPPIHRENSGSVASFESNNGKRSRTKRPISTDERIKSMDNVRFPSIHCERSQHESVASFDSYKTEQNEMDPKGSSVTDCFEENGLPGISPITENTLTDLDLSNANEKTGTSVDSFQGKDPHDGNCTNIRTSTSNAETSFKVNSYDHITPSSANTLEESGNERSHLSEYANSKSNEDQEESETGKKTLVSWNSLENGDEEVDQPNNMQNLKNSMEEIETREIQQSSSMESSDETITHLPGSTPESAERFQSNLKETETKPSSESKLKKTKSLSESKQRLEKIKLNKARRKKRNALIGYI